MTMAGAIAERVLFLDGANGAVEIPVRIYAPQQESDGAWKCPYSIGWPEGVFERAAFGADSMQALILALQIIGVHLYASEHHKAGRLRAAEPGGGYGFPVTASNRDMLEGDDKTFF